MRNDVLLFFGILVFFFALWLYGGGPNHPISFAGPYLTPITTLSPAAISSSVSSSHSYLSSGGYTSGGTGSTNPSAVPVSQRSGMYKQVLITGVSRGNTPSTESVSLQSQSSSAIDITGWTLTSTKTGARMIIPQGTTLPRYGGGGALSDIVLAANGYAMVTTGTSPANQSYLENECTDYLTESSYSRCVAARQNDREFTSKLWYIFLFQNNTLWTANGDTITLRDQSGKIVDRYVY